MQRIPFVPENLNEPEELLSAIKARRGGKLLKLDRMLLHSPNYAEGWNSFLGKVRTDLQLPAKLAELAICYVAILNGASYELEQHAPIFITEGGTEQQLAALQQSSIDLSLFEPVESAVLSLTREMTKEITVSDNTLENLREHLGSPQKLVEIIGVVAAYNMVSRFLVATQISSELD
jgi:alkylhydroperoxidase family enzyme